VTYFQNFMTPSISRERLEQETSYLARTFNTRSTNEGNAKLGQKGQVGVSWPTFEILGKQLALETSNLAGRFITSGTNEGYAKLHQRGSGRGHV